jgi:hypothetical protein
MPTLIGNNSQALGGANNLGQVVGIAATANQDPNCVAPQVLDFDAVIWTPLENRIDTVLHSFSRGMDGKLPGAARRG